MTSGKLLPICLRPVRPEDEKFLFSVFTSTRPDIMWANLPKAEIDRLMRMQFTAQRVHYAREFPDAQHSIILHGKEKAGRLYVNRSTTIHIVDIAILTEHRNQGIGTRLMTELLQESKATGKPVRIYVEHVNRANTFYERLGFVQIDEMPTHRLMEWKAKPGIHLA